MRYTLVDSFAVGYRTPKWSLTWQTKRRNFCRFGEVAVDEVDAYDDDDVVAVAAAVEPAVAVAVVVAADADGYGLASHGSSVDKYLI